VPGATTLPCHAGRGGTVVPPGTGWPCHFASRHSSVLRHGATVSNLWNFRVTPSDHFCDFKLTSLTLISTNHPQSFYSFSRIPENTKRCRMREIYTKGGRFSPFSTRSNVKSRGKGHKIGAKIRSKNRFITYTCENYNKPTIKSMGTESHFHTGTSNCCKSPASLWCSIFTC